MAKNTRVREVAALVHELERLLAGRTMRFMEVCGTHTVSIFQSGLHSLLPAHVVHLSGPGCPVCVTHDGEIAAVLKLATRADVCLATFGDLLRVPGPSGKSLKHARAEGAKIEVVYSPLECLRLAKERSETVVFLGIGFETTAPTVAATIAMARAEKIKNFAVFSLHKLVPPVLRALLNKGTSAVDAFLLPGHVATVTGLAPFAFLGKEFGRPAVVSGFEPEDILLALCVLAKGFVEKEPVLGNCYPRAVANEGNPKAQALMEEVFAPTEGLWRGIGAIHQSGLTLQEAYSDFDARKRFEIEVEDVPAPAGCRCGEILQGILTPSNCPLFGKTCTPLHPVGPCMVSTEGSCAAWYKYKGVA